MEAKLIRETQVYECNNCKRKFATENSLEDAEKCCICPDCEKPKGHKFSNIQCRACEDISNGKRSAERIAKIPVIKYDPNYIYHDDNEHWFHDEDGIYCHLDECLVDSDRDEFALPEYLYVSEKIEGIDINAFDLLENALAEHHEDARDDVDCRGLQKLLDKWCSEQKVVSWSGDTKQKVLVSEIIEVQKWHEDLFGAK